MIKITKIMFKTFQTITILASTVIGTYAMDEQDLFDARYVKVLSQDQDFASDNMPEINFAEFMGDRFEKVELQETNFEEQKEYTPKLKKKKTAPIPARFTSPNTKTKLKQERATRYATRSKNKENIHSENGCSQFPNKQISQKPLTSLEMQAPTRVFQPIELPSTPQSESKQPVFCWSHIPQSYTPIFSFVDLNLSSLDELPEWDDIASNF